MEKDPNFLSPAPNEFERMLAMCALFADNFSIDWIEELDNNKASDILYALEEGIKQGLLSSKGHGIFCFKNLNRRKQWEKKLSQEEKNQLHRRIADLLIKEFPDDDKKALSLSYHLQHIRNNVEGCRWLIRAGNINRRAFRIDSSLKCYGKVLDDLSGIEGEEADELFCTAAIEYSKISTARQDTTKVISTLQQAMEKAKKWDNETYQALLKMHLAKNEWLCSQYREAVGHFEQGWSIAKKVGDSRLMRSANNFATFFLYWQGRFREAISHYEKVVPEVQRHPRGSFPILAAITVGQCYAMTGQVTQGLGMLDAIRKQCRESGDFYMAAEATATIGAIMLEIRRMDDALQYLECSIKEGREEHNEWVVIWAELMLALAYFLKKGGERKVYYLKKFLESSAQVQINVRLFPYLPEIYWAIKQGELPSMPDFSLEKELFQLTEGKNVFLKGVAYRYQALLQKQKGLPWKRIIQTLNLSVRWLEESGHQIELAKTQLEIARQYLSIGDEEKAKKMAQMASKVLDSHSKILIPDDLKALIKDPPDGENLVKEILKLGQEVATIRDNRELVQHIISTVNRITGAERGAIFLLKEITSFPVLYLRASKNLTSDQVTDPSFESSMKMIKEVALTGKGRILEMNSSKNFSTKSGELISSRICVPMIFKDRVVGVLYHDNRLLSSAFKESDLEILSFFAAQAAIALDNAKAYEEIQELNRRLKEEKCYFEEQHLQSLHFEDIVGESAALMQVLGKVDQVAKADTTVLIVGETGVGKELVARAIHRYSPRGDKPFIRVFCSAIPDSLIPSELFGHEKGAFTGAIQRRIGRFELADGGTLFLDEIGDLPLEVQVRLLRVLQSKEFERVGGSKTIRSDFRLVAATNRNLEQAVKTGRFRPDLYYRLNVFPIQVPPLRERKEDIPLLVHYFLRIYSTKMGKPFDGISKTEMDKLIQYDWPGNIRELENIIERGTILSSGPLFRVPELGVIRQPSLAHGEEDATISGVERRHILGTLQKTGWKVRGRGGAAAILNIHPSTLDFRMKKLGIQRPLEFSRRRSGSEPRALTKNFFASSP